jgi:hypothetical protein
VSARDALAIALVRHIEGDSVTRDLITEFEWDGYLGDADYMSGLLTAAGYVILPAEMTAEQAARSMAGSAVADRLRVSSPEHFALMVEARRATWREMVAVMRESGDE